MNDIKIIKNLIYTLIENEKEIDNDTLLNEVGIDSLRYVELVLVLEEEYSIQIEDEDLIIENFETIDKIIDLINSYR